MADDDESSSEGDSDYACSDDGISEHRPDDRPENEDSPEQAIPPEDIMDTSPDPESDPDLKDNTDKRAHTAGFYAATGVAMVILTTAVNYLT